MIKYIAGAMILLASAIGMCVVGTIPPAPDPDTLPSSVFDAPAADYLSVVDEARSVARDLIADEKLPGLSLAVAVAGEIVWAEGLGWADIENEVPATPATLYRIGAISESLTAAAVGLLSERGRLDLDAPVQRYVTGFPEKEWPVTTRALMAHSSGVRPYRGEGGIFGGASCTTDAERVAVFADDPLRYQPGTEVHYSAFGWMLVGAVVAAAADEPYLDFLGREVLALLGMEHTVPDVAGGTEAGSAHFYYPRMMLDPRYGRHDAPEVDLSCFLPAVGFLSTPSDLVRLGTAMMDGSLLDPATVQELQTPMQLETGDSTGALGWTVQTVALGGNLVRIAGRGLGEPAVLKPLSAQAVGGQVAGATATLLTVPEHRVAIAVASNVSGAKNVSLLATRLADRFVRHLQSR